MKFQATSSLFFFAFPYTLFITSIVFLLLLFSSTVSCRIGSLGFVLGFGFDFFFFSREVSQVYLEKEHIFKAQQTFVNKVCKSVIVYRQNLSYKVGKESKSCNGKTPMRDFGENIGLGTLEPFERTPAIPRRVLRGHCHQKEVTVFCRAVA